MFEAAGFVSEGGVLSTIIGEYPYYEDQYDFFLSSTYLNWGQTNAKIVTPMTAANFPRSMFSKYASGITKFAFQSISLYELFYILDQPGERLISMNGSW